jgi:hypothetical protein
MELKNSSLSLVIYLTFLFTVCFISISGCATVQVYSEPDLPREKIARILGSNDQERGVTVSIIEIDNKALSSFKFNRPIKVNVLPGIHVLKVRYERVSFSRYQMPLPFQTIVTEGDLELTAEASKNYLIKASSKGYGVKFWIEEAGTGKVVSQDI